MILPFVSPPIERPRPFSRRPEIVGQAFDIATDYDLRFEVQQFRLRFIPCAEKNPNVPPPFRFS
jgi:hypothetical protein